MNNYKTEIENKINRLKKLRDGALLNIEPFYIPPFQSAIDSAITALKKQIPKKPIAEADGYADGCLVYDIFHCPLCDALIEDYDSEPHHCICGQALDWSEEND